MHLKAKRKLWSKSNSSQQSESENISAPLLNVIFDKMIKERKSPWFEVFGSQIEIISTPEDYYLALHKLMLESQFRINMSALYIGTGKLEKFLLDRLNNKVLLNHHIKVNIILDYLRGIRPDKNGESSMSMLSDLYVKNINHKFLRFGFFNHPNKVNKYFKFFHTSAKEVFGVHHIKAHVFDNNVLITGANLSEDYFTNRQDRWYIIRESPHVANYFDDLLDTLTNWSFQITHESTTEMQKHYPDPMSNPSKFKETLSHLLKLMRFANKTNIPVGTQITCNDFFYGKQDSSRPLLSYYGSKDDNV